MWLTGRYDPRTNWLRVKLRMSRYEDRFGVCVQMYRRIQQQAGFIQFVQKEFEQARALFLESEIDVREVSLPCSLHHRALVSQTPLPGE